jgi:hypothetical protein
MIIHAEVVVTPDRPVVIFREPREKVDLDVELPRTLNSQGWGVGTYFNVQFISHDRTILLASAEFVVTEVREGLHTNEANPYQPITKMIASRKFEQIGDWWPKPCGLFVTEKEEAKEAEEKPSKPAPKKVAKAG